MKVKEYNNEFGGVNVEEYTANEIKGMIADIIDAIDMAKEQGYRYIDDSIYVEYKDGSYYYNGEGGVDGKYKKSNIKGVIIDCSGCCYQIYGKYTMLENLIPELV